LCLAQLRQLDARKKFFGLLCKIVARVFESKTRFQHVVPTFGGCAQGSLGQYLEIRVVGVSAAHSGAQRQQWQTHGDRAHRSPDKLRM
jgi:hypothetical protein